MRPNSKIKISAVRMEIIEAELETLGYETARKLRKEAALRAMDKHTRYNTKNRALKRYKQAAKRAGKAMPKWLTDEQKAEMLAVYEEAERWEEETGVRHDVDHIVPLNGVCPYTGARNICGLHVPWNLRAIPSSMNKLRGHKYYNGGPSITGSDEIPF